MEAVVVGKKREVY